MLWRSRSGDGWTLSLQGLWWRRYAALELDLLMLQQDSLEEMENAVVQRIGHVVQQQRDWATPRQHGGHVRTRKGHPTDSPTASAALQLLMR